MSVATLLHVPDDPAGRHAFEFEHAMAHREVQSVMAPLSQWSVSPYFIDPTIYDAKPGTNWHKNHQQAHDDFASYLPAYTDQTQEAFTSNPGIPTAQIVLDSNLEDPESRTWWTFINHQEHYTANQSILPLPLTPMGQDPLTFELLWWLQEPRLAAIFW